MEHFYLFVGVILGAFSLYLHRRLSLQRWKCRYCTLVFSTDSKEVMEQFKLAHIRDHVQ